MLTAFRASIWLRGTTAGWWTHVGGQAAMAWPSRFRLAKAELQKWEMRVASAEYQVAFRKWLPASVFVL